MVTTSVGLFDGLSRAIRAIQILQESGFSRDEISLVVHNNEMDEKFRDAVVRLSNPIDKRKLMLPSDLATFVVDAQSLFVGGLGWVAMAGPIAFLLAEATDKTQAGDLIESLVAFDVSDEEAEYYAEGVRRGGALLAVTAANHLAERAEDVLLLHGAVDIRQRTTRWRRQGWDHFSYTGETYSATDMERERQGQAEEHKPGRDWNPYDRDFRSHYYLAYSDGDFPYEHYISAYCYGYQLASDRRYHRKHWDEVETQIQQAWERQGNKDWMTIVDAVSYGFLKGRENGEYYARY